MDLKATIAKVKEGDVQAFTQLVQQYQNLAFGYAFSILKDFHRAQDAVQEAFIVAYYQIPKLEEPEAFPGWLKGIVRHQCYRFLRGKANKWVSLDSIEDKADEDAQLDLKLSEKEQRSAVLEAISSLSDRQREVISLFYIEENSQKDVAAFLEMSVSDVNNCLHAARKTLKERMNHMADQKFKANALPKDFAEGIGKIIKIQGNIIDVEVDPSLKPLIFDDFKAGKKGASRITVVQRLKNGRVRCLVSGEFNELKANTKIQNESENSFPTLDEESIQEAIAGIGTKNQDHRGIFETGIKVIDLLCPFPKNGNVGMIGGYGAGRTAVLAELYKKFLKDKAELSIFFFVSPMEANTLSTMLEREPDLATDEGGPLQTAWLITPQAAEPDFAKNATYLESRPFFSPVMASQGRWPAIDPLYSYSELLKESIVGEEHYQTAIQVKELLEKEAELMKDPVFFEYLAIGAKQKAKERANSFPSQRIKELSKSEQVLVSRATKLRNFLTQPFFVTEHFTKVKGVTVSLQETIVVCRKIISGEMDAVSEKSFLYVGGFEDIKEKA